MTVDRTGRQRAWSSVETGIYPGSLIFRTIVKRLSFSDHNPNVVLSGISLSYFSTLLCLGSLVSQLNVAAPSNQTGRRVASAQNMGGRPKMELSVSCDSAFVGGKQPFERGTKVWKKGNARLR